MVLKLQKYSKYAFIALFLILLYFAFLLIKPFAIPVITSLLIVYILYPLYKWVHYFIKNKAIASVFMITFVAFLILIPLAFIINAVINETVIMYHELDITEITSIVSKYTSGEIGGYLSQIVQKAAAFLLEVTSGVVLSLPKKVLNLVIMAFVAFFAFKDGEILAEKLGKLLPLKKSQKKKLHHKFVSTINGVVYGLITISILEGIIAIPAFYIFHVPSPFLWGLIMVLFSIIPGVGPATLWVPMVLIKLFYGQFWDALGLALYCSILISLMIDLLLKHKLISEQAKIHPVITLIGVLGGLNLFGLVGMIIGPLILVLAMLFIDFYIEEVRL